MCLKVYILFFLCLVTIIKCTDIPNEIVKNIKLNNANNDFYREIIIYDLKYNIFVYNPQNQIKEIPMDKVNALYLVSSCSFANWTIFYLSDFVQKFPLFYSHKFLNSNYKNEFIRKHPKFTTMLNNISRNITNFIQILNYFINTTSHSLHYKDNTILTILLSLKIKIEIILYSYTKDKIEQKLINDSDVIVIREMVEEMNAIQIFLSMNCDNPIPQSAKNYNSQLYGYLTTVNDDNVIKTLVQKFELKLEPHSCSIQQRFLQSFIGTQSTNSDFARDIGDTNSIIHNDKGIVLQIKDVFKQIQSSYDINIIYWYLKSIIVTIVKLLYSRIMEGMQKMYLTKRITILINSINNMISLSKNEYPKYLVDGFALFKDAQNRNKFQDGNDYVKVIDMLFKGYTDITPHITLNKYEIHSGDIKDSNETDEDYTDHEEFDFQNYMISFMKTINENLYDFKCFNEYLAFFENEFNKQYLPHNIFNHKQMNSIDNVVNDECCTECYFIIDMYLISYKSVVYLNKSINQEIDSGQSEKPNYFQKAQDAIDDIRNHFFVLISMEQLIKWDLRKIGIDIVTILINQPIWNKNNPSLEIKHLRRIINFIMAILNSWGIPNCKQPTFNLLLFNNVIFNKFKKNDTKQMHEKQEKFKNMQKKISEIKPQDYQCFNYEYLYPKFIKNKFNILKHYENIIQFQWKGNQRTMKSVYADINDLFFTSHDLYTFYDTYFVFHIAAFYYELNKIYRTFLNKGIPKKNWQTNIKHDSNNVQPNVYYCPKHLTSLFNNIKFIENNMHDDNTIGFDKLGTQLETIEKQITNFNIIFIDKKKKKEKNISDSDYTKYKNQTNAIINGMLNLYDECGSKMQFNTEVQATEISEFETFGSEDSDYDI